MKRYKLTLGYLFILFVFAFSCRPEGEVVRADLQSFSQAEQAKIGNELSKHITNATVRYNLYRPSQNQKLYSYLNTVLSTIVNTTSVMNRTEFNWKIFVIRDEESKSAFTLPGGKIYITSSFLKFIESEAQLISVLSHEMCYADHSIAMEMLQDNFPGLILGDLVFDNPVDEIDAMIGTLQNEPYTMANVLEADLYSLEILCPFQYEATGIATIIGNVNDENFPLEWLDTRPSYTARMDTINSRAAICGIASIEETRYQENVITLLD